MQRRYLQITIDLLTTDDVVARDEIDTQHLHAMIGTMVNMSLQAEKILVGNVSSILTQSLEEKELDEA